MRFSHAVGRDLKSPIAGVASGVSDEPEVSLPADTGPSFLLVVGGTPATATAEVVSLDPDAMPVPDCLVDLARFPAKIDSLAGAPVGKSTKLWICTQYSKLA